MSQNPKAGRQTVIFSLIVGGLIVSSLLLLRLSEERVKNPSTTAIEADTGKTASTLPLRKLRTDGIQNWILEEMQKQGAKLGVVNIWATWCAPCRDEMPELAKFQKSKQVPLFLISADNELDEPSVKSFLAESGVDFETSLIQGDQQEFIERWQSLSSADPARQWSMTLPATFLINASGQIISFSVGTSTAAELSALVKKTLDTAHD